MSKKQVRKSAKEVTEGLLKAGRTRQVGDVHSGVKKTTVFEVKDTRNRKEGAHYAK